MKTIGIIGGLTWLSTIDYYRLLNQIGNQRCGGNEYPNIIVYSVNFGEFKVLTETQRWNDIAILLSGIAKKLQDAGADCLLIGANTMHRVADEVQQAITIPVIHIAEETAKVIAAQKLKKLALLGTRYTMVFDFFRNKLALQGIDSMIPGEKDIGYINNAIYTEMGKGLFLPETKSGFLEIIDGLVLQGAEGIILGCTEIPILIKAEDCRVPVFDTTLIHAQAAIEFALG
ncbi:MAG: aspartate/glutamate racemase family protein [Chitinophagaceae bacterium]